MDFSVTLLTLSMPRGSDLTPNRHLEQFRDDPRIIDRLVHRDVRLLEPSDGPTPPVAVRTELSTVKLTSAGVSTYWPMNARLTAAVGNDLEPAATRRGMNWLVMSASPRPTHMSAQEALDLILVEP